MSDGTKIEWTDATWNPIVGCSVVSPGCTNCYAMRLAGTRMKTHPSRAGLTKDSKAGPVWTGEVRFMEQWLAQPLRWAKPRMIFVCAHADLFHENVPDEWIDRVFAVMALCPQHTFQVLTKRPERMREYMAGRSGKLARFMVDEYLLKASDDVSGRAINVAWPVASIGDIDLPDDIEIRNWPLPNVWLGVSVEDQRRADERIPILLDTPAAVRWVSAEPLLGPISLAAIDVDGETEVLSLGAEWLDRSDEIEGLDLPCLDWVVAGGESGPNARVWSGFEDACRALRDQCRSAGIPFFMKQMQGVRKAEMPVIPDDLMIREAPHAA